MILVTVGTSSFDGLVREVDRLIAEGHITEDVYAQIGHGGYIPQHVKQYRRLVISMEPAYQRAGLVITHGGVGTCIELLAKGIPFILVPNPNVLDDHQKDIAWKVKKENWALVCYDVKDLLQYYEMSKTYTSKPYKIADMGVMNLNKVLRRVTGTNE